MKKQTVFFATVLLLAALGNAQAADRVLVLTKSNGAMNAVSQSLDRSDFAAQGLKFNAFSNVRKILLNVNGLILNGASDAQIAELQKNPNVLLVEKEVMHPAPAPVVGFSVASDFRPAQRSTKISLFSGVIQSFGTTDLTPWGITAVKAAGAWQNANDFGKGARVAVLDTGIDKDHPSLKDNFTLGKNFVDPADDDGLPVAYDYFDREGHGTHVSGTIAGEMDETGFSGVAPQASLLMGRVCSSKGCSSIALVDALDWAIAQNADVISMSLGGTASTPGEAAAVQQAADAGIAVVAASGNGDKTGKGQPVVSFPAALPQAIAVGAVDSTLTKAGFSNWGPELAVVGPGVSVYSTVPQGTGRVSKASVVVAGSAQDVKSAAFLGVKKFDAVRGDLVFAGLGQTSDFAAVDVAGKFALVQRGTLTFAVKVANAVAAKAIGVVIFNNVAGLTQGALTQDGSEIATPVVMIEQTVGQNIRDALARGDSANIQMSVVGSNYATFDGTSMATPHVSGVAALIKAVNHTLNASQVKQILQSTAQKLGPNDQNQYGAGLVNADAAVQAALRMNSH